MLAARIEVFSDAEQVAHAAVESLIVPLVTASQGESRAICLSGGSTPQRMYRILAQTNPDLDWSRIHFFWGDERCVPPQDPQSNFGEANELFLSQVTIPAENIHRIAGELDPQVACQQYSRLLDQQVRRGPDGWPEFDLMLLGMGDDGHTASIFPDRLDLVTSDQMCAVAQHPQTGQSRVTLTGRVLAAAKQICILVTGSAKADVLAAIIGQHRGYQKFPTSLICQMADTTFYLDQAAAARLDPN